MKSISEGFLYCVYSEDGSINKFFKDEFLVSLNSLKSVMPNCHVTLYTNIVFENIYQIDHIIYDEFIIKDHIAKAYGLSKSPYQKTIFLDTDIVIHRKVIKDIFTVLKDFDFTCCYGNFWHKGHIFPDLSTGILGVKNNPFTQKEIQKWIKEVKLRVREKSSNGDVGRVSDQKYFRNVFMRNKTKFHILPWWFQHRSENFIKYFSNIVTTHSHSMCKNKVTQQIINKLK
jgi:hypothetical protein